MEKRKKNHLIKRIRGKVRLEGKEEEEEEEEENLIIWDYKVLARFRKGLRLGD